MPVEERDLHTGYLTTGHEWNGIKELNRPVPKVIWLFLSSTFLFALACWILMPAWPLGNSYTRGLLGVDQRVSIAEKLSKRASLRADWVAQIETAPFDQIRSNPDLMRITRATGKTLFGDNCAVCHGTSAHGGSGYPNLTDNAWLWGGEADAIYETLRVGINSNHPETRVSQMIAFGHDGVLDRAAITNVTSYVQSLSQPATSQSGDVQKISSGAKIYAENCASCHGKNGHGNTEMGAPNLTDNKWIYGGDRQSIFTTINQGRQGEMPAWESRLTSAEMKILVLYVLDLGIKQK